MRCILLFLLLGTLQITASVTYSQATKLSIQLDNKPLQEVLSVIEQESSFYFTYNLKHINAERKVSVDVKDKLVTDILDELFAGENVKYVINDKHIVLYQADKTELPFKNQQNKTITGVVTDKNREPIIGANVSVKGTTTGTITDIDGKFSLEVVGKETLLITYIGYVSQEIAIGSQSTLKISLSEDTQTLDEVIVVGYGTQKKVNLSGAVASLDVAKMAENRPINNISTALAGMAAGVKVSAGKNAPGDDAATIMVRGQGTLNTSTPLVIIDGVEGDLNSVAPNDLENISILKDAASASIYGSRAANGVILITTKKGKQGKLNLSYNGYVSIERPTKMIKPVSDYARYMELMNEGYKNSSMGAVFSQEKIDLWRSHPNEPLLYPNTDAFDVLFGNTALAQHHSISASGGSDKITYYTAFTYLDNPGVVENTDYQKYSLRSNIEGKITNWITLGTNISGYYGSRNINAGSLGDVFNFARQASPCVVHRHPDGRYGQAHNSEDGSNNVFLRLNNKEGENITRDLRTRFYTNITPIKGLTISGSYTYSYEDNEQWNKPLFIPTWNFLEEVLISDGVSRTSISNSTTRKSRNFMDGLVSYETRLLNDRFSVYAMFGASQEQWEQREMKASKYDLLDPALDVINAATGDASAEGKRFGWAMRSYFGRINLGWDDKYLLEFNLRSDGSSRFTRNNRWGYFPSASGAWRMDQEAFLKEVDWLDNLKLRASYGSLGNNAIGNYDAISVYSKSNYILGNGVNMGLSQTSIANSSLTWESTYVTNVGVDFGFLANRLTGTIDVFKKRTDNILINLPAPAVHGEASLPKKNSAEVVNKGIEITAGWRDNYKDFSYYVNANFTYIKNEVTQFKGGDRTYDGDRFIQEGYPIKVLYLRPTDGIIQDQNDLKKVQAMLDAEKAKATAEGRKPRTVYSAGTPSLGDVLFVDSNGDGIVDYEDRVTYGEGTNAPFSFGFDAGISWKGIDFSFLLQGMVGGKTVYTGQEYKSTVNKGFMINEEIANGRWHEGLLDEQGNITQRAKFPRFTNENDNKNIGASDFWLVSQDYLRVKNIQLGYTFPKSWMNMVKMEKLRVYASLENFFTITSYPGLDPESGWAYPAMKQASFGVNITF